MDFGNFIRECYLRSIPSVDLNDVTSDNPVNCSDHRLSVDEYENILREFDVEGNRELTTACNMWMLQSGPQLFR